MRQLVKAFAGFVLITGLGFGQLTVTPGNPVTSAIISASHSGTLYVGLPSTISNATETNVKTLAGVAGTFANLNVVTSSAPGGSDTIVATVRKNASDTTITCTITGSATSCADATHTFTVVATDLVDVSLVYSTAVTSVMQVSTTLSQATGQAAYNNQIYLGGSAPTLSACGTSPTNTNATDNAGIVTLGTGVVLACTSTFATAFTHTPACTVSSNNATSRASISAVSTTALTVAFNQTGATTFSYTCN